jgi:flagellum-specific peptidoglycan hydrolase FlgJ
MNGQQNAFLKTVVPAAQAAQKKWGVPASVTIAQAILESSNQLGWGQSQLAREAHNYFGIKAVDLTNPENYIELPTHEFIGGAEELVEAAFARYEEPAESFDAHGRLLATAKRYAPAMAVRNDPIAFAAQLQHGGYSTSPTYASSLWKLIQAYDLTQYDLPPDGGAAQAAA